MTTPEQQVELQRSLQQLHELERRFDASNFRSSVFAFDPVDHLGMSQVDVAAYVESVSVARFRPVDPSASSASH